MRTGLLALAMLPSLAAEAGPDAAAEGARPPPAASAPLLKPPPLRPGDTVVLVGPASPAAPAELDEAAANLRRLGYRVKVARQASARAGYLAGEDEERAQALNRAFADPEARLVLCVRGGYGSPRLLDRIDYDAVRRSPKALVGYSDITALLIALQRRAGLVTFHGPMAERDFSGRAGLSPFQSRHLFGLLGPEPWRPEAPLWSDWGSDPPEGAEPRRTIAPGVAEGPLTGGNLSIVAALLGTPYEIDTRGAILFLEDVNEEPFRIDRMLAQLRLSGKLAAAHGVLLGGFTRCVARTPKESFTTEEVLDRCLGGLGVPVLAGFPAGHLPEQAALPFGVRVRLDASRRTVSILEPAVDPAAAGDAPPAARERPASER